MLRRVYNTDRAKVVSPWLPGTEQDVCYFEEYLYDSAGVLKMNLYKTHVWFEEQNLNLRLVKGSRSA